MFQDYILCLYHERELKLGAYLKGNPNSFVIVERGLASTKVFYDCLREQNLLTDFEYAMLNQKYVTPY